MKELSPGAMSRARVSCASLMIPLAVSGRIVIGVAVVGALVLVWVLLRLDTRDEATERAEEEAEKGAGRDR